MSDGFVFLPVIEKQFLSGINDASGEYSDSMITIDHFHPCITVWINRVIRKSNFIAFSSRIHNKIYKKTMNHTFISNELSVNNLRILAKMI